MGFYVCIHFLDESGRTKKDQWAKSAIKDRRRGFISSTSWPGAPCLGWARTAMGARTASGPGPPLGPGPPVGQDRHASGVPGPPFLHYSTRQTFWEVSPNFIMSQTSVPKIFSPKSSEPLLDD
ncbi:hypothetical protein QAD02_011712 [Eretmocerus hayati]|uniref:Uncharacterized protein n=1 Tax=Eretmocerus hayati TaxID=131215 RepID=A0ACC2NZC0_9HYME|nr:hypothetical protein QAD02_011712 [Eretmocerus hayati]